MRPTRLWPILAVTWLAGCTSEDSPRTSNRGAYPIVGGTAETGYPGVGALVIRRGAGTALCTGTKIGDGWVLTAAHCVVSSTAADVQFFDGPDVSGAGGWHPARTLHVHPLYVPGDPPGGVTTQNDVALVEVTGIGALPTYETAASPAGLAPGLAVTWVGYGLNRVAPDSGDGLKRRGAGHLSGIYWTQLVYTTSRQRCRAAATRAGRCSRRSAVASGSSASSRPERRGLRRRRHHRLCGSTFAGWIADVMAGGGTGSCDPTGGDCSVGACLRCERPLLCVPTGGDAVGGTCEPDGTSWSVTVPCADGAVCLAASSAPGDGRCHAMCRADGDCATGETCYLPVFRDIPGVGSCWTTPVSCDIVAADCPTGQACYPDSTTTFHCFPSDAIAAGEACPPDPSTWTDIPCDDGLVCVTLTGGSSLCARACRADADCAADEDCHIPIFAGIPAIGVCLPCTDADADGFCADVDCNDHHNGIYPGADERCDNDRDDDCDGETDEGCAAADADADAVEDADAAEEAEAETAADGDADPDAGVDDGGADGEPDGGGDAGFDSGEPEGGDDEGCGCRAPGSRPSGPPGCLLVGVARVEPAPAAVSRRAGDFRGRDRPPTSGPDPFGASSRAPTQHEQQQSSYQTGRETNTGPSQQLDWPAQTRTTVGPQPQPPSVPVTTGSSHVLAEPLSVCSRVFFGPFVDLLGGFAALLVVLLVRFFMIHLQRPHPPVRPAEPMSVRIRRRQPERWRDEAGEVGISSSSSGSRGWGS